MLRGLSNNLAYVRNDVRVFANAIASNGGVLSRSSQLAVNTFLNQLQAAGLLAKTKDCGIFVGSNTNAALVKLVGTGLITTNMALTYAEGTGVNGNALIAGSIDTLFVPTANGLSASDICLATYSLSSNWSNILLGSGDMGANGTFYVGFNSSGGFSFLAGAAPTHPPSVGLNIATANASAVRSHTRYFQHNSVAPGSFSGSVIAPSQPVKLLNYYQGMYFPSNAVLGGYWAGNSLSQAEVGKLSSAFDRLHFDIGRKTALSGVFFGDSITAGVGASVTANRWSSLLSSRMGITENNKGISGSVLQNTAPVQSGNGRDRYLVDVYNQRPWRIFILYGINDIRYNSPDWTPAAFQNDLQEVVSGLISGGVNADDIILGSPPFVTGYIPSAPYDGGSISRHLAHVAAVAAVATNSGTRYVDVYRWMMNNGGAALVSNDTVHPNDAGHLQIANAFLSVL